MNALAKKLHVKPSTKWLLFNPPANYLTLLEPLPEGVQISYAATKVFDGVQLFVKNNSELASSLKVIAATLKPDTIFWIMYPKKSSGVKTDLEMMSSWEELAKYGWNTVAAASVDNTWTALRFKPAGTSKMSEGRNDSIRQNEHSEYIDVDNKQIKLPSEIAEVFEKAPAALSFYQSLSYSNKKEYVLWILTAKQEKTREERLVKMIDKMAAGKKNPSEK